MHKAITQDEYQKEIKNFIDLSIDEVSVFFDSNLLVGGFSLIHILNEESKQGKILSLSGNINYKKNTLLHADTNFQKTKENGRLFEQSANEIKKQILKTPKKISKINFENDSKNIVIIFDDESEISIEANSSASRPLAYDNHEEGYAVYFGEKINGDKEFNYFKTIFK